jgi:O-antigen biosynthesis protein WbqP
MLKRLVEFIVALILILPVFFVSLFLMLWIRLETPGFPLVFQKRVGRNERIFTCLKLRTFEVGSEVVATHEAQANKITPTGRILRPLHLDELPQIWNVLTGDMSFVGPRPCLPFMSDVIEARRAENVQNLRPGITGIAQLEGVDMRYPEKLAKLDAILSENHSLLLDMRVCLATVLPSLWQRWRTLYIPSHLL